MISQTPEAQQRTRVGGIKLSCELVKFTVPPFDGGMTSVNKALQTIAGRQINIPYLSHSPGTSAHALTFCVDAEERVQVEGILKSRLADASYGVRSDVATLTVFPHGHDLQLLAAVVNVLQKNGRRVHGLCTSISALTLLTDFSTLDVTIHILDSILELPENHTPLRQEIAVRQVEV